MFTRLLMGLSFSALVALSAHGQVLSGMCLSTMYDSLFPPSDSFTVTGTCDSIVVSMKIGAMTVPMITVKKLNSCSLSLDYAIGANDTDINYCQLPVIQGLFRQDNNPGIQVYCSNGTLKAQGRLLCGANDFVLRLFDERGRSLGVFKNSGLTDGSPSWNISALKGTVVYTIEKSGNTVASGRINLIR